MDNIRRKGIEYKDSLDKYASSLLKEPLSKTTYGDTDSIIGRVCKFCGKEIPSHQNTRCSECRKVFYCKKSCQKQDWEQHRKICG